MKRNAWRWRSITAVVAVGAGAAMFLALGPRPKETATSLVTVAVPADWKALPVTARLGAEVVSRDVGCEGHGEDRHDAPLGRFTVSRVDRVYKGSGAGVLWCEVSAPGLRDAVRFPPYATHACPDEVREDAATHVHVLAAEGHAVGAFRVETVTRSWIHEVPLPWRLFVSALAMTLAVQVMATIRAWRDDRA